MLNWPRPMDRFLSSNSLGAVHDDQLMAGFDFKLSPIFGFKTYD
ncbi:hypothetical protein MIZ03_3378 [Rhodoferax lithotrophicus]|uniref:Uncharacterized protein n=1 Tax=Rhodoferax lithotrophicus TaxID=2798804 RepID=A0ABM7MQE0_9BURK|nr:hypothetical protein MIZ03_3378 [Rhodoferax sp. MIZ03]